MVSCLNPSLPYSSKKVYYLPGIQVGSGVQVPYVITSEHCIIFPFATNTPLVRAPDQHLTILLCFLIPSLFSHLTSTFRKVVRLIWWISVHILFRHINGYLFVSFCFLSLSLPPPTSLFLSLTHTFSPWINEELVAYMVPFNPELPCISQEQALFYLITFGNLILTQCFYLYF